MSRKKTRKPAPVAVATAGSEKTLPLGWILTLVALIPALFFFGFGKYLELNTPGPFDSGAYVYSAQHLLEGAQLGVDENPTARPGTLLMNVIGVALFGFNDTGPKLIQMLLQLAALGMMFWALWRLCGRPAAIIGVTVAAFYLSAPHVAKYGNVKEQFMIAFMVTAASAWILYEITQRRGFLLLTGAAVIWPYYFKPTGLSIMIVLAGYLVIRTLAKGMTRRELAINTLGLIAGAAVGILPLAIFSFWQGMPALLFNSFPFFALRLLVVGVILYYAIRWLVVTVRRVHLFRQLRQVRPAIWIAGTALIGLALLLCVLHFARIDEFSYYWNSLFFVEFYSFVQFKAQSSVRQFLGYAGVNHTYLTASREEYSLARQASIVFRYYRSLAVPVFAGGLGLLIAAGRLVQNRLRKRRETNPVHRLALLLGAWWLLDMAFVWISPRPYEEYYLPLCASGAMLAGYLAWICSEGIRRSSVKPVYAALAGVLLIAGLALAWPVYFGYTTSVFSGQPYGKHPYTQEPLRRRGYVQAYEERIKQSALGDWVEVGNYIRQHSEPGDPIYVWGWYPGIYVQAQRMAPLPKAFESDMHTLSPGVLSRLVAGRVRAFKQNPPQFIVDSRKQHFPFDRPPLELWPQIRRGSSPTDFLPAHSQIVGQYEQQYKNMLAEKISPQEAQRFEAMKPFRDFVMEHYRLVRAFGDQVLFKYKGTLPAASESDSASQEKTDRP